MKKELDEQTEYFNKKVKTLRVNNKSKEPERNLTDNSCSECEFESRKKSGLKRHITTKHKLRIGSWTH